MNLEKLLNMQRMLDDRIRDKHDLIGKNLIHKKVLAFLVELGELANETRCFKFWSLKPPSEKRVILEEFVDGLHFILSLAIELNCTDIKLERLVEEEVDLTIQFRKVFRYANDPIDLIHPEFYIERLLYSYLLLGRMLGFSWEEIEEAYFAKNQINHERQDIGY